MISPTNYLIKNKLYEGKDTEIYHGVRVSDGLPVVFKLLKVDYPTPEQLAQIKHEYDILLTLKGDGAVEAYDLVPYKNSLAIVLEDFGQRSLQDLITHSSLHLDEALNIAILLTECIEKIHQQHIIHKDINPSNLLWDPLIPEVKLVDFSIAFTLAKENIASINPDVLEGTLAYLSPEQTGCMNRDVDYRSDYYSLGVTLYQMITGVLPFQSQDPMELIHAHIATLPKPPHELNSDIPLAVSNIILKLMAKTAEERYQSMYGLREDLKRCATQLRDKNTVIDFPLGQYDRSSVFKIPEILYGREQQLNELIDILNQVAPENQAQLVLVSGFSGIGKSSLVHELDKSIINKRGYFISGKFDQLQKNIPYTAFIQAFDLLIRQLLSENEIIIGEWRNAIQNAVGIYGKVVTDFLPSLKLMIGNQPEVSVLNAVETQNRFNSIFQSFIMALVSRDRPIIIFLDDLQWTDLPSLQLIKFLLTQKKRCSLLIIGSYRDNEVNSIHPLSMTLKSLTREKVISRRIVLKPLELEHVHQMLVDALHQEEKELWQLAAICFQKTQGNPFFLHQFLKEIHKDGLILFNNYKGFWEYDLDKISEKESTGNVVDFMAQKIQKLSPETQTVLKYASCLGSPFELRVLSHMIGLPPKLISTQLWESLQAELIVPLDASYKYISEDINSNAHYRFFHDNIQQAVYCLIPETERKKLHLKIGRQLLSEISLEEREEGLFDIVSQLNMGIELIEDKGEKIQLAKLNLKAGEMAKSSVANAIAMSYLQTGLRLVDESIWITDREFALRLHTEAAQVAHLCENEEEAKRIGKIVISHTTSILEQLPIYNLMIHNNFVNGNIALAGQMVTETLQKLGMTLPKNATKFNLLMMLIKIQIALLGKTDKELLNLPDMTDPYKLAISDLIGQSRVVVLAFNQNLFYLQILKLLLMILHHGYNKNAPMAFSGYAMMLCNQGHINRGYRIGELVLAYLKRDITNNGNETIAEYVVQHYIKHWKQPLKDTIPASLEIYMNAMHVSNHEIASTTIISIVWRYYITGFSLEKIKEIIIQLVLKTTYKISSKKSFSQLIVIIEQTIENLTTLVANPGNLEGSYCKEEGKMLEHIKEINNLYGIFNFYFIKMQLGYLFYDFNQAYLYSLKIKELEKEFPPLPLRFVAKAYDSLTRLAIWTNSSIYQKIKHLIAIRNNQKCLAKAIKQCPANYKDQYFLVKAELARVMGRHAKAARYYDQAIELAKENEFTQNHALANEMAGRFYFDQGKERIAQLYFVEAHYAYLSWGATTKAQHLLDTYKFYLPKSDETDLSILSDKTTTGRTGTSNILDLSTAIKASQAIAREFILENLLTKSMRIMIENAGAQKGYLLLETKGKWAIESALVNDHITILKSLPLKLVPKSVIQFVIRSKEFVLLDDARQSSTYAMDPYIRKVQPKSMLCLPLLNKGHLSGILYLENDLTSGAFTKSRLTMLNFLAAQMIISIDIARLYKEMADLNKKYSLFIPTEFLRLLGKKSIMDVKLGDHVQQIMTVMFCDVRSFTTRSESMTPGQNFDYINSLLSYLEPVISKHHGVIDKFIGDAILALFINADDAVESALGILQAVEDFNQAYPDQQPTKLGIGLNTGQVMLGILGGEHRMEGSVISDVVNVASRVEEQTKMKQVSLLITANTLTELRHLQRYKIQEIDSILLRGKTNSITVYEVRVKN
jgi:predicted ATPase/class 3 adenylate cyclase/GAF domain-containing protein